MLDKHLDESTRQRAHGWDEVVKVLDDVSPGWSHAEHGTGIELACNAIRALHVASIENIPERRTLLSFFRRKNKK